MDGVFGGPAAVGLVSLRSTDKADKAWFQASDVDMQGIYVH